MKLFIEQPNYKNKLTETKQGHTAKETRHTKWQYIITVPLVSENWKGSDYVTLIICYDNIIFFFKFDCLSV